MADFKCSCTESFQECVWITVSVEKNSNVLFGCVYRSPSSSDENNRDLETMLRTITDMKTKNTLIVGDFNYPTIDWMDCVSTDMNGSNSDQFMECLKDCFLIQHLDKPTRFRGTQKPSLLDLVLTNEENVIRNIEYLAPVGSSDHCTIVFDYTCKIQDNHSITTKYKYDKGDYKAMRDFFTSVKWEEVLEGKDVQESWEEFRSRLEEAMQKFIPKHNISSQGRKFKRQSYMDKHGLSLVKQKNKVWEKYLTTHDLKDYREYCKVRNSLRENTRELRRNFEERIADEIKENPKAFWKYTKSKTTVRSGVSDLKDNKGAMHSDDSAKSEILNDFFCSVFTREDTTFIPELETKHHGPKLLNFDITDECVEKHIRSLKASKSAGPDGFHPRVLKEVVEEIAPPLRIIFMKSLQCGMLPSQWKLGQVTPIFKKGDRSTPGNYRPVSLTAVLCKVMETIVRSHVMDHMVKHQLFCEEQHGFVPGRSCMTQLITCIDDWSEALDRGEPLDAIYLDFKKAFDTVPHERLIQKLVSYGIDGNVKEWISSFLHGRKQRVSINGHTSQWSSVTSGIPQGSVLGPILFVVFINDLPDVVKNVVRIFADDTKLYGPVSTEEGRTVLQEDTDKLSDWSDTWLLKFNTSKCSVMHLGRTNPKHTYNMRDNDGMYQKLEETEVEKDLGVYVDNKLSFHQHVNTAVNKATRILGVIKRTFTSRSKNIVKRLYTTLVRPTLEYGNAPRTTQYIGDMDKIENVQRRATKLCTDIKNLSYEERLRELRLPSMYYRRERGDMIQVFKILTKRDRVDSDTILPRNESARTRGHSLKLSKRQCRLNIRKHSFGLRVTNKWNSLPESVISAKSVNDFKAKEKYRGVFEIQKSGDKTNSGEIGLDIRTHASPKVGQDQVSGGVSVLCWHAAPVAYVLWKPCTIR